MRKKMPVAYFLTPTFLALLVGGFFLASNTKSEIHLFINAHHAPWADIFFKYLTFFGEGWVFALALPAMIFFSWRSGIQLALTGIFTGLFTGIFKQVLFSGEPRPIEYFKDITDLYLVPGAEMNLWNSFPSGHTMAAFSFYFALTLLVKKGSASVFFFIIAFLIGFSRMYLSQHFLVDVVAGACLGIVCASLAYVCARALTSEKLNGNILGVLKKSDNTE